MESNNHPILNGRTNGSNGHHTVNGTRRTRSRPPTVEEALPYSPFSSVAPFNSGTIRQPSSTNNLLISSRIDIIPLPRTGLRSSTSLFSTATERDEARRGLDGLNYDASDPYKTSQRLQQTLQDLKQLLQPEKISQL